MTRGFLFKHMKNSLIYIIVVLIINACAQPVAPTGGKRDKILPKLVRTYPLNQTTSFKEKKVELEFDEYVTIDNLPQKLLITPAIEGLYTQKINPKGLTILFDKEFKNDVTYSLNFRDAIKDASEGNVAKNVRLVFSTGKMIDSLKVEGQVKNIQTGKSALDILVGLYVYSDTLNIKKEKPYYFIKTDSAGKFQLNNIKSGKYQIIALGDANSNLLYNPENENIGFEKDALDLKENKTDLAINIFLADGIKQKILKTRNSVNYYYIDYLKGVMDFKVDFENKKDSIPYIISENKTLKFYNTQKTNDTLKVKIEVIDSLGNKFSHDQKLKFRVPTKKEAVKEAFEVSPNVDDDFEYLKEFEYKLKFTKPVAFLDISKIKLTEDTLRKVELKTEDYKWNPNKTELEIKKSIKFNRVITFEIQKGAIQSIEKDTLKPFEKEYKLKEVENYGTIAGEVKTKNPKTGVVVQLIDKNSKKVIQEQFTRVYNFEWLKTGVYQIRVIEDLNNNKKWDTGIPEKYIQPERIVFYPDEIVLKSNFDLVGNDIEID